MKRILIALALSLGATAAMAEPSLDLQGTQQEFRWKNAPEQTSYRGAVQLVDDNAADYPFNP